MVTTRQPKHLGVVDPPTANPLPEPEIATKRLTFIAQELGAAFGVLKSALRPIKGDLDQEIARLETLRKQQPPLWESKMLLRGCGAFSDSVATFITALTQAQALKTELGPIIQGAEQLIQVRREEATVSADLEALERYVVDLQKTRRVWGELSNLVDEAGQWEAIARVSTGRHYRATMRVVMDYEILRVSAALENLKAQREKLRHAESPVAADLTGLHQIAETIVGQSLPLMTLTWPESNDPFTGPTLG